MLFGFLMTIFIVMTVFLAILILLQQGKGDMGLGSLATSSQAIFGGSGGQEFFEKLTWILGLIFIAGSLMLSVMKSRQTLNSQLSNYRAPVQTQAPEQNAPEDSIFQRNNKSL